MMQVFFGFADPDLDDLKITEGDDVSEAENFDQNENKLEVFEIFNLLVSSWS